MCQVSLWPQWISPLTRKVDREEESWLKEFVPVGEGIYQGVLYILCLHDVYSLRVVRDMKK